MQVLLWIAHPHASPFINFNLYESLFSDLNFMFKFLKCFFLNHVQISLIIVNTCEPLIYFLHLCTKEFSLANFGQVPHTCMFFISSSQTPSQHFNFTPTPLKLSKTLQIHSFTLTNPLTYTQNRAHTSLTSNLHSLTSSHQLTHFGQN